MKQLIAIIIFVFALTACESTPRAPRVLYRDGAVVHSADVRYRTAVLSITGIMEQENRQNLFEHSPVIKHTIDQVRRELPWTERTYMSYRGRYLTSPELNKGILEDALAALFDLWNIANNALHGFDAVDLSPLNSSGYVTKEQEQELLDFIDLRDRISRMQHRPPIYETVEIQLQGIGYYYWQARSNYCKGQLFGPTFNL